MVLFFILMIIRNEKLAEEQLPAFLEEICGVRSDSFSICRTQCPSPNNKISYAINRLSLSRRREIEEHAENCPECYEDLYIKTEELLELAGHLKRTRPYEQRDHQNL